MSDPTFTTPPTAPSRAQPATFSARMDAFLAWIVTAWGELSTAVTWFRARTDEVAADASAASSSASAASSSASAASSSATAAATSASNASTSESNASTSESNAAASLTSFRGVYLGEAASDPTTDLNGDPLGGGELYFNTSDNAPKIYSGGAWRAAVLDADGAMMAVNNLSEVDATAARTNLGLGSAATSAASAFATAAQGTAADAALPRAGGTMTGAIDMGGQGLSNVAALAGAVIASQGEAEAGTDTAKLMTPERVAQAIAALSGSNLIVHWVTSSQNITLSTDTQAVMALLWGGGGGGCGGTNGYYGSGGGGGACSFGMWRKADLPANVFATIGSGGVGNDPNTSVGGPGGYSRFHTLYAYGGGGGHRNTANDGCGGGGGGALEPGFNGALGTSVEGGGPQRGSSAQSYDSAFGGGAGGAFSVGDSYFGGGGGSRNNQGGSSVLGGGGGGTSGGTSYLGGNGGARGTSTNGGAGQVPGGGGGGAGSGLSYKGGDGGNGAALIIEFLE